MPSFYFIFYMTYASLLPFLPLYLTDIGIGPKHIGLTMALGPLTMIIGQPFWSALSDKLQRPRTIIQVLLGGSALAVLLFQVLESEWTGMLLSMFIYTFFQSSIVPIADSIVLNTKSKDSYGQIRLWGSIGYAVMVILMGYILKFSDYNIIFVTTAILMLVTVIVAFTLPNKGSKATTSNMLTEIRALLGSRDFLHFLGFAFIVNGTFNGYNSFFGLYLKESGASDLLIGGAYAVAAASEIPIFYYSTLLLRRYRLNSLLLLGAIVYAGRWLFYAHTNDPNIIVLSQILHGFSFGIFYFSAVHYASNLAPRHLQATAQGLFAAVSLGLGSIIGSFGGGILADRYSTYTMFEIFGWMVLFTTLLYAKTKKRAN